MVIDTSAILAVIFKEPHAEWVIEHLEKNAGLLLMSTVNLAEALIKIRSKQSNQYEEIKSLLMDGSIQFIEPNVDHVERVVKARLRFPINLGDCFAYALAKQTGKPILTLDSDFTKTDVPIIFPEQH